MPQIELMMSDLPHTLYNSKKKGKTEGPSTEDIDEATKLFMEAQARKANGGGSHTVEELFNGDAD